MVFLIPSEFRNFLTERPDQLFWSKLHQIYTCLLNVEEMWGVPEHTSVHLLCWFRTSLWEAYSRVHEKTRSCDLAWSQSQNVLVAFHSLGHGVRQIIASGLRPWEPLRECSGFVTQPNLVILCPSVTGLLPKEGEAWLLRVTLSRVARHFFAHSPRDLLTWGSGVGVGSACIEGCREMFF